MSDAQKQEQDELQKYLEAKAKQDQEKEQKVKPLSAYEACVLKESAKVHELIVNAQKNLRRTQRISEVV